MNIKFLLESFCFFLGSLFALFILSLHSEDRRVQEWVEKQIVDQIPQAEWNLSMNQKAPSKTADSMQEQ